MSGILGEENVLKTSYGSNPQHTGVMPRYLTLIFLKEPNGTLMVSALGVGNHRGFLHPP
jgi:hypothetical protein